jgi:CNP1-like family.
MSGMKRPFILLLTLLPGLALAVEYLNPDFVEDNTPWEEVAARLPAYPKDGNLVPFVASSATNNKFMIDAASLSVGKDGVVRYTVVIESPRGARTVNYEGLRCDTAERKIYAFGQADGKWTENKRAAWESIKVRSMLSYHKALFEDIFCDVGIPVGGAEEAVRKLKQSAGSY